MSNNQQVKPYPKEFESSLSSWGNVTGPDGQAPSINQLLTEFDVGIAAMLDQGVDGFDLLLRLCWVRSALGLETRIPYNVEISQQKPFYGQTTSKRVTPPIWKSYKSHIKHDAFDEDVFILATGDVAGFRNAYRALALGARRRPGEDWRALLNYAIANPTLVTNQFGQRFFANAANQNESNYKAPNGVTYYNYAPATPLTMANVEAALVNLEARPNAYGEIMGLDAVELHVPWKSRWAAQRDFEVVTLMPKLGPGGTDTGGNTNEWTATRKLRVVPEIYLPETDWFVSTNLDAISDPKLKPFLWLRGIGVSDKLVQHSSVVGPAPAAGGFALGAFAGHTADVAGIEALINTGVPEMWVETRGPGSYLTDEKKEVRAALFTCMSVYAQSSIPIEYRRSV